MRGPPPVTRHKTSMAHKRAKVESFKMKRKVPSSKKPLRDSINTGKEN